MREIVSDSKVQIKISTIYVGVSKPKTQMTSSETPICQAQKSVSL